MHRCSACGTEITICPNCKEKQETPLYAPEAYILSQLKNPKKRGTITPK